MTSLPRRLSWGEGAVYHRRHGAVSNAFRYPTFFLLFDVRDEGELRSLFRERYRSMFSIRSTDYLDGREGNLDSNAREFISEHCGYAAEEIELQTYPRMFGYVFNPVSFWFCKRAGVIDAILCEVRNTFGEKHFYWLAPSAEGFAGTWRTAEKVFHVSPFQPVDGHYRFRFVVSSEKSHVDILYYGPGDDLKLTTSVEGMLAPIAEGRLARFVLKYGWLTALVTVRIHTQAVRLWFKKAKFFSKPSPPLEKVTQ